jgi:hypothetical protein
MILIDYSGTYEEYDTLEQACSAANIDVNEVRQQWKNYVGLSESEIVFGDIHIIRTDDNFLYA